MTTEQTNESILQFVLAWSRPTPLRPEPKQSDFATPEEYASACIKWVQEHAAHTAQQNYFASQEAFFRVMLGIPVKQPEAVTPRVIKRKAGRPLTSDLDYAGVWLLKQPELALKWVEIQGVLRRGQMKNNTPGIQRIKDMWRYAKKQIAKNPKWIESVMAKAESELLPNTPKVEVENPAILIQQAREAHEATKANRRRAKRVI